MTLTPDQLRAARGLLNISQDELAEKAGVAVTSLRQFELGKTKQLQQKTEDALMAFFLPQLEFIGTRGVALREEIVRLLEGENALASLFDDITHHLRGQKEAEALFLYGDPFLERQEALCALNKLRDDNIRFRHLSKKDDDSSVFADALQVVYGPCVAQMVGITRLQVTTSPLLADTMRETFEALWHMGTTNGGSKGGKASAELRRRLRVVNGR